MTAKDKAAAKSKGGRKLTAKQRRFAEEYLVDLNATQAAKRAGYSEKTANEQGARLLANVSVAAAIEAAQEKRSERTEITQDMVLRELAKIGFADIRKVVRWGSTQMVSTVNAAGENAMEACHGLVLVGADEIDDDTAAAIAEISEGREGLKVKLHDKKGALVDIGKHLGMFKDRVEHTGKDGGPVQVAALTREEYKQARQEMLADDDC